MFLPLHNFGENLTTKKDESHFYLHTIQRLYFKGSRWAFQPPSPPPTPTPTYFLRHGTVLSNPAKNGALQARWIAIKTSEGAPQASDSVPMANDSALLTRDGAPQAGDSNH